MKFLRCQTVVLMDTLSIEIILRSRASSQNSPLLIDIKEFHFRLIFDIVDLIKNFLGLFMVELADVSKWIQIVLIPCFHFSRRVHQTESMLLEHLGGRIILCLQLPRVVDFNALSLHPTFLHGLFRFLWDVRELFLVTCFEKYFVGFIILAPSSVFGIRFQITIES